MYSVLGNHKTMTHRYTVNVIHVYRGLIVFTQHLSSYLSFNCYSILCFYSNDLKFAYKAHTPIVCCLSPTDVVITNIYLAMFLFSYCAVSFNRCKFTFSFILLETIFL